MDVFVCALYITPNILYDLKLFIREYIYIYKYIYIYHCPQFECFLKDFFDEYKRHLAENFHAFCVIL